MIYKVKDSKVNSNGVCNYYDFIRREELSLAIWFDIVELRENIHMTVKIFANVHQLMFLFRSPQERNGTVFGFEHHRTSYPIICQYSC